MNCGQVCDAITELLRAHARTLIAAAIEAEVASVVAELKAGGTDVIRNEYLPERKVSTAFDDVKVTDGTTRLRWGELRALVVTALRANPGEVPPATLSKMLGRSTGSVHNALVVAAANGEVVLVGDHPCRWVATG